ncbi:glycylpeptide N-tetradecanoyltransferase 2 [Gorgonomyces haynaldii]|nr:glycylpeptide N-tetradecanoyltransferase 2 [Gorgonomyces haynaldii]
MSQDPTKIQELLKKLALQNKDQSFKFWKTQPVPQLDETVDSDGKIEEDKSLGDIRQEPYPLGKDFEWCVMDIDDQAQLESIYTLLLENYVEDEGASFRFAYSPEFLLWALKPPGFNRQWHLGVRVVSNKKLVAFIAGTPADLKIREKGQHLVEINFLCVHKKLRSKRLAPVLIKEITRRVNITGTFQAVYTAGVLLPKPFTKCQYFHRSLNPKKLVDIGFSYVPRDSTLARMIKMYKVKEAPLSGLRLMEQRDVKQVQVLLGQYLEQFEVAARFSEEEIAHWLLPRDGVIYSYVIEEDDQVTDFVSFYCIPSSVTRHPRYTDLKAAYLFYYVPKGLGHDKDRLELLIKSVLVAADSAGLDVFNCLDMMHNKTFLDACHFKPGDGYLHYYLYNYRCKDIESDKLGLVML